MDCGAFAGIARINTPSIDPSFTHLEPGPVPTEAHEVVALVRHSGGARGVSGGHRYHIFPRNPAETHEFYDPHAYAQAPPGEGVGAADHTPPMGSVLDIKFPEPVPSGRRS